MIETTKNIVWAVNSLFLVLWLQHCSISLPTLDTYIDFRLLNHKWQNTFDKGHTAKKKIATTHIAKSMTQKEK